MSFKKALYECMSKYVYPVRIKTCIPITETMYQLIQSHLYKYRMIEMSEVKKTIFQKNPLHFGHIEGSEIWYVDALLTIPVSSYILSEELRIVLKIPDENLVVITMFDPREQTNEYVSTIIDMEQKAREEGLEKASRLSTDSYYMENETVIPGDTIAGQRYNEAFKKFLSTMENKRPNRVYKDESNRALFGWLWDRKPEPKYGENDFNYHIKDSPKVYPVNSVKEDDEELTRVKTVADEMQLKYGTFYNNKVISKPYRGIEGKKIEFVSMPKSLRTIKNSNKNDGAEDNGRK